MNREILFKAKRIDNGEWVEGYYEKYNNQHYINKETDRLNTGGYPIREFIEVNENTLCQFTGLTDKNGNKIWENDIVKYPNVPRINRVYWIVEYSYGGFRLSDNNQDMFERLYIDNDDVDWEICEVLGNIFDNADLLGKE